MELGDLIKSRRRELGMTQNELAEGICTQALVSRIENNDTIPSNDILNKMEQRLQLKEHELSTAVRFNSNQHKIDQLIEEIREYLAKRDYKSIELLLNYHADLVENSKDINELSFFNWMRAALVYQLNGECEKGLALLSEIPIHDLENELSIEILNAIGLIYYEEKEFESALSHFFEGMQKINDSVDFKVQAKLQFNYVLALEESAEYRKALTIILAAIDLLLANDSLYLLGDFYYTKGYIFEQLNNSKEALESFQLAQAIFKIQNNSRFYDLSQMAISEIHNNISRKEELE